MTNKLAQEVSPYLLQHKDNPVHWYSWGPEAFTHAREQAKPIFLSIGYATCYWCHVMEKESFEHKEVAEILNRSFICIKVDREERPDIDQIYMDAVIGLTGHGGWPMSVFLTPDKKPFFGGTYFPRQKFINLLHQLDRAWKDEKDAVLSSASSITEALKARVLERSESSIPHDASYMACKRYIDSLDKRFGGFGRAPKFPPSQQIRLLLAEYSVTGEEELLHPACFTLEQMAKSALFDHLEGGFHRYATDEGWEIPHFEKMLYDNALLIPAYLDAYLITRHKGFAAVATHICDYLITRMQDPRGGFYSAEDAGEVGKEGEFYVWDFAQLEATLSQDELEILLRETTISRSGNFEGHNTILLRHAISAKQIPALEAIFKKLRAVRDTRKRPFLDDKILTSWNGLAIGALAYAGRVLNDARFIESAMKAAQYIQSDLYITELLHRARAGTASISGLLEDYVFLIQGLLELYQATFDERWLTWALELQNEQEKLWGDTEHLYRSSAHADLLFHKVDVLDGALPATNSVALHNLKVISSLSHQPKYEERIASIWGSLALSIERYPNAFPVSLALHRLGVSTIQFNPKELTEVKAQMQERYLRGVFFSPRAEEGGFLYCKDHICALSTESLSEALANCPFSHNLSGVVSNPADGEI